MTDKSASANPTRYAILAIGAGLIGLALKWAAFEITGSVSLFSDALESIVNTVAAVGMLVAIRVAAQPPDRNHPFGHTKAEYLAAVIEGALILYAAVEILKAAWMRLGSLVPLESLPLGLGLSLLATVINGALAFVLVRAGRRYRSPALYADGKHLWADVVTTIGVLAGVSLAGLTGLWILDPLLAIAVAIHVLWVGVDVVRDSVGGLMDKSLPEMEMSQIRAVLNGESDRVLEVHDLRSRLAAGRPFVEFHLVVPRDMSVAESHEICDEMEDAVRSIVPRASVLIHVEPEEKAKFDGGVEQIS